MAHLLDKTNYNFLNKARPAIILSLIVMLIGGYLLITNKDTILGMDFTGGYSVSLTLPEKPQTDYKEEVSKAFVQAGAHHGDFHIRELNTPNSLKIQFGTVMQQTGHPFHGLTSEDPAEALQWITTSLEAQGITLDAAEKASLRQNWSEMSGQFSDTMRNNALLALGAALFAVLIYITIRFEFKYGISAIIGLVHDVLITLALLGLLHLMGVEIQFDLQVVAAVMTIIGYSLNDTIIIFDRVREDLRLFRKLSFAEIVNLALNSTLSRTLMTSGTVLLVLVTLVIFGGSTIFNFSLVMLIGVIVGTLSSLFVAAPLLLYFHNKELTSQETKSRGSIAKASNL